MMNSRLPVISGRDTVKALGKAGFEVIKGRGRGSHMVITKANPRLIITVPDHRELDRVTLRAIIRQAGLSVKEFNQLVN